MKPDYLFEKLGVKREEQNTFIFAGSRFRIGGNDCHVILEAIPKGWAITTAAKTLQKLID